MEIAVGDMAITAGGNIMPRGDRRGPNGMGPMTGRGAGFCNGFNAPGYMNQGAGGYGMGAGRGFGGRHNGFGAGYGAGRGYGMAAVPYNAAPIAPNAGYSKEAEKGYIENEVSFLKDQLKALEGRLADMQEDK